MKFGSGNPKPYAKRKKRQLEQRIEMRTSKAEDNIKEEIGGQGRCQRTKTLWKSKDEDVGHEEDNK